MRIATRSSMCDIKPDNIILLPDGGLQLMDFGLLESLRRRSPIWVWHGWIYGSRASHGETQYEIGRLSLGLIMYRIFTGNLSGMAVRLATQGLCDASSKGPSGIDSVAAQGVGDSDESSIPRRQRDVVGFSADQAKKPELHRQATVVVVFFIGFDRPSHRFKLGALGQLYWLSSLLKSDLPGEAAVLDSLRLIFKRRSGWFVGNKLSILSNRLQYRRRRVAGKSRSISACS